MRVNLFVPLIWAFCTALPSSPPEHAPQSEARLLPNFISTILSVRDSLFWTDDIFSTDAMTNNADWAPDTDAEGLFSEQDPSLSINSGNDVDGQGHDNSIQDYSTAALASAYSLEGPCSAASHSPANLKIRLRDDASCPSPEAGPSSRKDLVVPSIPNLMDQFEPQLPIDLPLFKLNPHDDVQCDGPAYNKHLCCDGPRGPWIDRWSHYDFVLNCLPCMVENFSVSSL